MGVLFLSHSSKDDELARRLRAGLRERGHASVFLDLDPEAGIQAGEAWQASLYRRLRSCQALVALVTDDFLASRWCFAEVALARMQGKTLFGVLAGAPAGDADLPPLLADRQMVDGRTDLDDALDRLARGLRRAGLSAATSRSWDRSRPPYPGFSAFTEADRGVFFGREAEVDEALERIRGASRGTAARLVMILGASGSGKSSLLRAGVVHRLHADEGVAVVGPFRPGREPLEELAFHAGRALGADAPPPVPDGPLGPWLRSLARAGGRSSGPVVVAVDQFEELLGRPAGHPAHALLERLREEVSDPEGDVSFVGTLRSDQLPALQSHPVGRALEWQSLFLGPLDDADLREIVRGPARLAELEVEDALVERLVADASDGQALPLVALMLRRLWEEGSADGLLELGEYEKLGGIRGVVARVADDAVAGVRDEEALEGLKDALLRMVRLDDRRNAVRQPVDWSSTAPGARPLLERLVRARLLVREEETVQVAHEALFTAWGTLREWIDEGRHALLVHRQVSDAAALWSEDRLDTDLWRGTRLDRALELREAGLLPLDATQDAFLTASSEARDRVREEARRQERLRERLGRTSLGRGLAYQALAEGEDRPQRGLLLAVEAARATWDAGLGVTTAAETALHELLAQVGGEPLGAPVGSVGCLAYRGDGARLAVGGGEGTVAVLDPSAPAVPVARWRVGDRPVEALAWVGEALVTRSSDGGVRAWSPGPDGSWTARVLEGGGADGTVAAVCATRGLAVVAAPGGPPVLHAVAAGRSWTLEGVESDCTALGFSTDGAWLVDGRASGQLALWSLDTLPDPPGHVVANEHEAAVRHVVWAGAAHVFVTADESRERVRRWEPGTGSGLALTRLESSGSPIQALAVDALGDLVVAGTWHAEALAWVRSEGQFVGAIPLRGHPSGVGMVEVSADGRWIATGSARDNVALLWARDGLREGRQPYRLRGEDRWLSALTLAPDGTVVAGSVGGTVRRWEEVSRAPRSLPIPGVDLNRYAMSWAGSRLVAAGAQVSFGGSPDGRGKVVHLDTGRAEAVEDPEAVRQVDLTPDGRWMALAGPGGVRVVGPDSEVRLPVAPDGWGGAVALDPTGRWVVAGEDDFALLFDLRSEAVGAELSLHRHRLVSASFDPPGRHLLTADAGGRVGLWAEEGESFSLTGSWEHPGVEGVAFLDGGRRWVAVAPERLLGGRVDAWDEDGGPRGTGDAGPADGTPWEPRSTPGAGSASWAAETGWKGGHARMAPAADGTRVLVATNVDAAIWDLADPAGGRIDLPRHEGYVESVALAPDGGRAATAMVDGPIRLWDLDGRSEPVSLPRHQSSRLLLEFVEDGRLLVSGESGGTLDIWDLDVERIVARARETAGRGLTDEERRRFLSAD